MEIRKKIKAIGYEEWEANITEDILVIDNLIDSIESEIKKGDVSLDSSWDLIRKLAKGIESFEAITSRKYSYLYPELSRDEIYYGMLYSEVMQKYRLKEEELNEILVSIRDKYYVKPAQ